MIKASEIQTIVFPAVTGVDAAPVIGIWTCGPVIPLNHRRYVYSLKGLNQFAGPNVLTVGARENGVIVTVPLWFLSGMLIGDIDLDPDGILTEDSIPLFSIGGQGPLGPALGPSTLRMLTSAGNMLVTIRYADVLIA